MAVAIALAFYTFERRPAGERGAVINTLHAAHPHIGQTLPDVFLFYAACCLLPVKRATILLGALMYLTGGVKNPGRGLTRAI